MATGPTDGAAIFRRHWGAIFGDPRCSPEHPVIDPIDQDRPLDRIQRTLSTERAQELDENLNVEELALTIRHLRSSSERGADGLSASFYKIFSGRLQGYFSIVFRYQFLRGSLLFSQRIVCLDTATQVAKINSRRAKGLHPREIASPPCSFSQLFAALAVSYR